MLIIGCDFHTRYQQIAMANDETGELLLERRLEHESGEAVAFYRSLSGAVRVGIEATGPIHWFVRLLAELGHELWIGDSAKIRASEVRKQKTDERDAALILDLLLSKRFPRIWVPTPAERDLGNYPLLNSPNNLRVGWSYVGDGQYTFRIGGQLLGKIMKNPHVNLWPPSWWFGPPGP